MRRRCWPEGIIKNKDVTICWDELDDKMCYFEPEKQYWVCEACFNEFRPYFHWTVTEAEDDEE